MCVCVYMFTIANTFSFVMGRRCPKCSNSRAQKTMSIWRLPPLLLVHFKRFSFNGPFRDKLTTPIAFGLRGFDLAQFVQGPSARKYNLYGVSNHYGSLSGGHYVAFCLNTLQQRCVVTESVVGSFSIVNWISFAIIMLRLSVICFLFIFEKHIFLLTLSL